MGNAHPKTSEKKEKKMRVQVLETELGRNERKKENKRLFLFAMVRADGRIAAFM